MEVKVAQSPVSFGNHFSPLVCNFVVPSFELDEVGQPRPDYEPNVEVCQAIVLYFTYFLRRLRILRLVLLKF